MNALLGLLIAAGVVYGVWIDATFWKIYGVMVFFYTIFVLYQRDRKENPKRKTIVISSWNQPNDPTSNVVVDINMDNALAYVKKMNEDQKDVHITMTHVFAHATAWGLYKMRRDVGHLPFGTFKAEKNFGVTVLVDKDGGADLIPVTIWDGHKMTIFELAKTVTDKVGNAKKGKDKEHNKSTAIADFVPSFFAQPLGFALTYLAVVVGVNLSALSMSKKQFGHVVITNVGTLGYNAAFAPLCPGVH